MLSFFSTKQKKDFSLHGDIHSHLLPGLDDGVMNFEEAILVIRKFHDLGYHTLVTTPHIMSDTYRNKPELILEKLRELNLIIKRHNIPVAVQAAAEYYLDPWLINQIDSGTPLLTFGSNYLLFEMNYITEPYQLKDFIFKISMQGYKPVLAHPERYQFMSLEKAEDLRHRGVLMQLNILSLIDFYSKPVRQMANQLIDRGLVDFLGSDCHGIRHASLLGKAFKSRYFKKALDMPLLNYQL